MRQGLRPDNPAPQFRVLAADLGFNEPTIASLLGHKTHSITSRYVHSADAVLLAAADAVANATMQLLGWQEGAQWVISHPLAMSTRSGGTESPGKKVFSSLTAVGSSDTKSAAIGRGGRHALLLERRRPGTQQQ